MVYKYNIPDDHSGDEVKVKDVWKGFREDTTAHGIPHVSNAPGRLKTVLWLVISLVACGALAYHLYVVITTYLKYGVTVKISLRQEESTDFPAVTVCNLNPIKRSALHLDAAIEELLSDDVTRRRRKRRGVTSYEDDVMPYDNGMVHKEGYDKVNGKIGESGAINHGNGYTGSENRVRNREQEPDMKQDLNLEVKSLFTSNEKLKDNGTFKAFRAETDIRNGDMDTGINSGNNVGRKKRSLDMTCGSADQVYDAMGMCYGVLPDSPTDQDTARWACYDENAGLYTPTSSAIENFVTSSTILDGVSFDKYWIYIKNDKWVDKVPVSGYTNYQAGGWEDGAAVDMNNGNQWLYYDRWSSAGVLCQKMVSCPNPVYTAPDGTVICWFLPFYEVEARWDRARDGCERIDTSAFLIEMDTEAKYNFMVNEWGVFDTLSGDNYWLNLKMDGGEDWQWSGQWVGDTWSNWEAGQPNGEKGTRASISGGHLWETVAENEDSVTAMVICEIRDIPYNGYFSPNAATTQAATTEAETTIPDTTTHQITTAQETTTQDITTAQETTTHQITTAQETATQQITTARETTMQDITTRQETTTQDITTIHDITTQMLTTVADEVTTHETTIEPSTTTEPSSIEGRPPLSEEFVLGETVIENLAVISEETKAAMGYSPYEFILDCTYEGWTCDTSHFHQIYDPIFGNCYIFNSGWNSSVPVQKSHRTGRRYGLSLVLYIAEEEYVTKIGGPSGVRVVVHDKNTMPHPDEDGTLARPGELTSIGVQKVLYKRKEAPYGDCTVDRKDDKKDMYGEMYKHVSYSKKNCYRTCYQRHVIDRCGCADSYYPREGKALKVSGSVLPCDTNNREEDDCRYRVNKDYADGKLGCSKECFEACNSIYFDSSISTARWPSSSHAPGIIDKYSENIPGVTNSNESDALWRNVLSVEVFYNDFNFQKIQEKESYRFGQFLSDVGGILGLWLGCSIITIFEFFELGLDLVVLGCCKGISRCRSNKTPNNQVRDENGRQQTKNIRRMSLKSVSSQDIRLYPNQKTTPQNSPILSSGGSSGFFDEDLPPTPASRRTRASRHSDTRDNLSRMALRNKRRVGNSPDEKGSFFGFDSAPTTPRHIDLTGRKGVNSDIPAYEYMDNGSPPDWWLVSNGDGGLDGKVSEPPRYSAVVGDGKRTKKPRP